MEQETLRKLQLTELSILADFADFCDENEITYFLSGGTLLGAVRHKGFIPWDDDVDVMMPYSEYVKFLELAEKKLDKQKYFLQTADQDFGWYRNYARLRLNNTTMMKPDYRYTHMHQGIYIDIFPLIEVDPGADFKKRRRLIKYASFLLMDDFIKYNKAWTSRRKGLTFLIKLLLLTQRKSREKKQAEIMQKLGNCTGKKKISVVYTTLSKMCPKEIFEGEPQELYFENRFFKGCPDSVKYLESIYGNWQELPPVEKRVGHDESLIIDFDKSYEHYQV